MKSNHAPCRGGRRVPPGKRPLCVAQSALPGRHQIAKPLCSLDGAGTWSVNGLIMNAPELRKLTDWLMDGARSAPTPTALLSQTCERLVDAGVPLWRVAAFVQTLHPDML